MIFWYILLAIAILLLMVLIHEFGHYVVGKILKFKITEFSIGFGFPIFSKTNKKTGEKFSLRIFPLGGYCAFDGEEDGEHGSPQPRRVLKQHRTRERIAESLEDARDGKDEHGRHQDFAQALELSQQFVFCHGQIPSIRRCGVAYRTSVVGIV